MNIRIAKIIDNRTIIINKGSDHGIKESSRFCIYVDYGNIRDPETFEDLGVLEIVKGYAVVYELQPKITVLTSDGHRKNSYKNEAIFARFENPLFRKKTKSLVYFEKEIEESDKIKLI